MTDTTVRGYMLREHELRRLIAERDEARRQLAEAREEIARYEDWLSRDEYLALTKRQLAEAAACVRGLIAFAKQVPAFLPPYEVRLGMAGSSLDCAFNALPAWLRREIEK